MQYDNQFSDQDYTYNQYITQAIEQYYIRQETDVLYALLQVLAMRISDGACSPAAYHNLQSASAPKLRRQTLTDGNGARWIPLYTEASEVKESESVLLIPEPLLNTLRDGLTNSDVSGVIINPFGQSFAMKKELLRYFLESSGLVAPEDSSPKAATVSYPEPGTVMTPQMELSMKELLTRYLALMELTSLDKKLKERCYGYENINTEPTDKTDGLRTMIYDRFAAEAYDMGLVISEAAAICERDGIRPAKVIAPDAEWAAQFSREQLLALISCVIAAEQYRPGALAEAFGSGAMATYAAAFLSQSDPLEV